MSKNMCDNMTDYLTCKEDRELLSSWYHHHHHHRGRDRGENYTTNTHLYNSIVLSFSFVTIIYYSVITMLDVIVRLQNTFIIHYSSILVCKALTQVTTSHLEQHR